MTGAQIAARFAFRLNQVGEDITVRRRTGTGAATTIVITKGNQLFYSALETRQPSPGLVQADQQWEMSDILMRAAGWVGGVREGDLIESNGAPVRISKVDTVSIGSVIILYNAWGRGG